MSKPSYSDEDLKAALRDQLRDELKSRLQAEEARLHRPAVRRLPVWLAVAAGLALLLIALWWWMDQPPPVDPDPQHYFQAYFTPYPNELYPIEMGESDTLAVARALQAYERADYEEALDRIRQLPAELSNADVRFYEAVALLALDRNDAAAELLEELRVDDTTRYRSQTEWYLVLAHLARSDLEAAETALQRIIVDEDHPYRDQAGRLSAELSASEPDSSQ